MHTRQPSRILRGMQLFLPLGLLVLLLASSTLAVMSGDERPPAALNDPAAQ